MHASVVAALGLGELTLESFLNEPLKATVDILSTDGLNEDQIRVRLATSDDFEKLGVDRAYFLTSIKFEIVVDERDRGKIILTSQDPVLEPYLDFLIEARWPTGRLLREYTVLIDPPAFDTQATVVSATERVADTEGEPEGSKKKTAVTETVASTTGTHVKSHKSDLAPGAMPDRDFGSDAAKAPLAGNQYMIRRDETLWGIALNSKPEGVSVHQTMLDIQRLNPDAFIDGNINRIKAGYIIYLPTSSEISSDDFASAQEEVRQQNQDWRDGVVRERQESAGASLRISADPVVEEPAEAGESGADGESDLAASSGGATAANLDQAEREVTDLEGRLAAMEEQVETMQRIVSLKDNQIAALQAALDESGSDVEIDQTSIDESVLQLAREAAEADSQSQAEPAVLEPDPAPVPAPVVTPAPAKPAPVAEEEGGNTLTYIIGLLVAAAVGAFFFLRRRGEDEAEETQQETARREVFADVKMPDSDVDLKAIDEVVAPEPEPEPESTQAEALSAEPPAHASRGYGEHKHDEYASDESGDALAEADIYIAYGRYPQAVDLLKTAIENEPSNPAYRQKMVELSAETGDRDEALAQYQALQSIGDAGAVSHAEDVLRSAGSGDWLDHAASTGAPETAPPGGEDLELMSDLDLAEDTSEPLESDFGGLEIEPGGLGDGEDDLDLSTDFSSDIDGEEEDLVFAEGGNEMSTKLDLARAYLDMGDEDGARQILEEVSAQGSGEQQEEARTLLERIG
jgi:pilus assembly protein FimV